MSNRGQATTSRSGYFLGMWLIGRDSIASRGSITLGGAPPRAPKVACLCG